MILLFAANATEFANRIRKIAQDILPHGKELEIARNIEALSERLRGPHGELTIAILVFDSPADLSGLLSLKDSFKDIDIILILPDTNSDTIIQGCKLYPRYFCYKKDDLSELVLVLAKMIKKHLSCQPGEACY